MTLTRVVKRTSAIVASPRPTANAETSLVQVHSLAIDSECRKLVRHAIGHVSSSGLPFFLQLFIICSDLLILMTEIGDAGDTVEPFTVIRLGKALGGKVDPASLFGSQNSRPLAVLSNVCTC